MCHRLTHRPFRFTDTRGLTQHAPDSAGFLPAGDASRYETASGRMTARVADEFQRRKAQEAAQVAAKEEKLRQGARVLPYSAAAQAAATKPLLW